jgi:hypothetical protein
MFNSYVSHYQRVIINNMFTKSLDQEKDQMLRVILSKAPSSLLAAKRRKLPVAFPAGLDQLTLNVEGFIQKVEPKQNSMTLTSFFAQERAHGSSPVPARLRSAPVSVTAKCSSSVRTRRSKAIRVVATLRTCVCSRVWRVSTCFSQKWFVYPPCN